MPDPFDDQLESSPALPSSTECLYGTTEFNLREGTMQHRTLLRVAIVLGTAIGLTAQTPTLLAQAAPAPEVEYTYDVVVRRHFDFPNNDAIGYGYGICDKVRNGRGYPQVMGEVKGDVIPNDEFAANYLVSYAVGILCPAQIWALRNSAAGFQASAT